MERCFIDTTIFLQPYLTMTARRKKYTKGCTYILEHLNKLYAGYISVALLGELFTALLNHAGEGRINLDKAFEILETITTDYIKESKIVEIKPSTLKKAYFISTGFRVSTFDALHIATAIEHQIQTFLTTDEVVRQNKKLIEYAKNKGTTIKLVKVLS